MQSSYNKNLPQRRISKYIEIIHNLSSNVLDLLFPIECINCSELGSLLCNKCINTCNSIAGVKCGFCGKTTSFKTEYKPCGQKCTPIKGISKMVSLFDIEGPIRKAIHLLKYEDARLIAKPLGTLLSSSDTVRELVNSADFVIPIPIHSKRLRYRGYNQAELLAKEMCKGLNISVNSIILKRVAYSKQQVNTQSRKEREEIIKDAFKCVDSVEGKTIILLDDVITTGSTISEAALTLTEAGAADVFAISVIRHIL